MLILNLYFCIGSCLFLGRYFRLKKKHDLVKTEKSRYFRYFPNRRLECKTVYIFLITYKFKIQFLGRKIYREKNFDLFFKTIIGSNISILMFILVENKISYNLAYEYFNKTLTCDCKIILN